ncbi:MAG TPA: septation regulator SpoVG [Acidobacteriota bacterium]|jgi:stage V sporulation protein G
MNLEITDVKVVPVDEERLKAFASIVFNSCFVVSDIKVIAGESKLFLSMPSKKQKDGTYRDVAHPLNSETRKQIEDRVLAEYRAVMARRGDQPQRRPAPRVEPGPPTSEPKPSADPGPEPETGS